MKIIGVTGGTGSGKSTLCAILGELGATVVDADKISKKVTQKGGAAYEEIVREFGTGILDDNGEIVRKALGDIVFNDSKKLELLERITHKHIFREMEVAIGASTAPVVVLDVPLLFQCDFPFNCDLTVATIADEKTRINRIMMRDGLSEAQAKDRIRNQLSETEFRQRADAVYENNGKQEDMMEFARKIYYDL